ncbi:MAG: 5-formyltetrahydrofolate cyclo-ligase [Kiritimatiellales bacterium]|nr:5-formyltetrahydrofolate cyclo-ligase [Kiritimatiellales bacterium]
MTKAEIRKQIAALRPDFQILETLSASVIKKFQSLELFRSARSIGAYIPLPDEVNLSPLFESLQTTFYIPAVDETAGIYRMARLTTELKKGRFGILEPAVPVFAAEDELDLILVPGIAFDRTGRRIGRGGGFYDRLLPQYSAVRAGICFDFQCLEEIPAEIHDIRMDWLVTETQILKVAMNS